MPYDSLIDRDVPNIFVSACFKLDEYFVGTGDINAGNLPKQQPLVTSEPASKSKETTAETTESAESKAATPEVKPDSKDAPASNKVKTAVLDDKDNELLRILQVSYLTRWCGSLGVSTFVDWR